MAKSSGKDQDQLLEERKAEGKDIRWDVDSHKAADPHLGAAKRNDWSGKR